MPTVAELLQRNSRLDLTLRAGPAESRTILDVTAVDSLPGVASARAGTMVVLMRAASVAAAPYELDVAIRQAADHGLAALVLVGREQLPVTSLRLADRATLPLMTVEGDRDVADLLRRVDRFVRGGAADALARAGAALDAIREGEGSGDIAALTETVSAALDREVTYAEELGTLGAAGGAGITGAGNGSGVVLVRGRAVGRLTGPGRDEATALVLPALSAAVSRMVEAELTRRFAPAQTRAELIAQILVAERRQLALLATQARETGLPIDDTHVAAWFHLRTAEGQDPQRERRLIDFAELTALRSLKPGRGHWHVARAGGSLLVLRTERGSAPDLTDRVLTEIGGLVDLLGSDSDAAERAVYVGIGTPQQGPEGLQQSAQEARGAADSAEAGRRAGAVVVFDSYGLSRLLAELYTSPFSSRLIAELLAPLDARGPAQSRQAIRTLAAYLDAQGSPTAAAKVLNLHPHAVSYRLKRIAADLDADLTDPDTRFALHLACRVRLIDH
jgi:sugar diacid utilization regulator